MCIRDRIKADQGKCVLYAEWAGWSSDGRDNKSEALKAFFIQSALMMPPCPVVSEHIQEEQATVDGDGARD